MAQNYSSEISRDALMNDLLDRLRNERFAELSQTAPNRLQFRDTVTRLDSYFGRYNDEQLKSESKTASSSANACKTSSQIQDDPDDEVESPFPGAPSSGTTETAINEEIDSVPEIASETVVEIQTLVNRRLVSSVLMRGDLRNRLESTLGAMRNLFHSSSRSQPRRIVQQQQHSATQQPPSRASNLAPASGNEPPPAPQRFVEPRIEIQHELEGLNSRQPVSRLLESGFAERLTNMIVNHLHLVREGLQPNQISDDNISIISSQTTVSTNANVGGVGRLAKQVKSMRTEMSELKSMLNLLMDAQQETQRLIKHEMAPRVQKESRVPRDNRLSYYKEATPESSSNTAPSNPDIGSNRGKCLICYSRPASMMVYRCGHMCMCYECSLQLRRMHSTIAGRVLPPHGDIPADLKCPVCRGEILDLVKVFSDRF